MMADPEKAQINKEIKVSRVSVALFVPTDLLHQELTMGRGPRTLSARDPKHQPFLSLSCVIPCLWFLSFL